jgi:hypothetical protein
MRFIDSVSDFLMQPRHLGDQPSLELWRGRNLVTGNSMLQLLQILVLTGRIGDSGS